MNKSLLVALAVLVPILGCQQPQHATPRGAKPGASKAIGPLQRQTDAPPKDLEECFAHLQNLVDARDMAKIRKGTEVDLRHQFRLASWLRDQWGLGTVSGESPLAEWFRERGIESPADMSEIILTSWYRRLKGQDIRLEQQIEERRSYLKALDEFRFRAVPAEVYELIDAMAAHDLEKVKSLAQKGADLNGADHNGDRVLTNAIRTGDLNVVRCLVQRGADVNAWDLVPFRKRPLVLEAVHAGNLDILRYLVQQGADVTAGDYNGRNAVAEAVLCRRLDMLRYLIEKQKMDINLPDKEGHPPIVFLYEQLNEPGAYDILKYALEKGADVSARDLAGLTLPDRAKLSHNDKTIELLKAKGVLKEE